MLQQRIFAQTKPRKRPRPGDDIEALALVSTTAATEAVAAADAVIAGIDAALGS
jgi:hypothetical protein